MKPFADRKPDKERLRAALQHEDTGEVPYWESTVCARNVRHLFGCDEAPELSWFLPVEDQVRLAQWTCQDVIPGGGFMAAPRVREADGTLRVLKEGELKTREQLESLVPYTEDDIQGSMRLLEKNFEVVSGTGLGVYVGCGGGFWQNAWMLMGFDEFMVKTIEDPEFIQQLIAYMAAPAVRAAELLCEYPITFLLVGDNIATSLGPFIEPRVFRPQWRPWVEKIIAPAQAKGIATMLNTDGKIDWFMDDIVEMGFDSLNPIDPNGNDIFEIKEKYGDKLCLVGGINQYWPLSVGSVEDVETTVREHIERLRGGGGFVVSSSHDIGDNVLPENWEAMVRATVKYS